ncbi:MAG TPA: dihydroorotate dehydrogenase electron transfer subunit [Clostridiales bacterium]|nr:dihydroorotate dehydrogenase electron transfer subunit [Clostridiales bacterium]
MTNTICRVEYNDYINKNIKKMGISGIEHKREVLPGQFLHIKPGSDYHGLLLRRPISISDVLPSTGIMEIIYLIKGPGTAELSRLKPGDGVDVLGPLGNGLVLDDNVKNLLLIGGGMGVAPLLYAARYYKHLSLNGIFGWRDTGSLIPLGAAKDFMDRVYICTQDGSTGHRGLVTDIFCERVEDIRPDMVFACGPVAMLKEVQRLCTRFGLDSRFSMEERMGCGVGSCMTCACKIERDGNWQYERVCCDGPVFNGQRVVFD